MDNNYKQLAYAIIKVAYEDLRDSLIAWTDNKTVYNKQRVLYNARYFYGEQFNTFTQSLNYVGNDIVMPLLDTYGFQL